MDLEQMAENIGLEKEEFIEMLDIFFESGDKDLTNLEATIQAGDARAAHESSHSLKGSSGSLGLDSIFRLATAIDDKDRQGDMQGLDEMVRDLRSEYERLVLAVRQAVNG